jgi:putative transposase
MGRADPDARRQGGGAHLVRVDRWTASSKTCSCGLQVKEELDLKERRWTCEGCGTEHDRDENAAQTIRRVGILDLRAGGRHVPVCRGLPKTVLVTAAAEDAETLPA